jgi:hypothetical protein
LDFGFVNSLVDKIIRDAGAAAGDVSAIAAKAGVKIVYENWYPVTIGEFERKTRTIRVNRAALEKSEDAQNLERKIIAHELGHFFALDLNLDKTDEERFAEEFAACLTGKY